MKLVTLRILCPLILVLTIGIKANAQWDLFSELLSQMDDNQNNQFDGNLNEFGIFQVDQTDLNNAMDGLYGSFNHADCPAGTGLDSSYFGFLNSCLIDAENGLGNLGVSNSDQDTVLSQFGFVIDVFGNNYDSLGNALGHYEDMIDDDPDWDIHVVNYDDLNDQNMDILRDTFDFEFDGSPANGLGNFANIIGGLFKESLFTDFELAFGTQASDIKYWDDKYSTKAKVFRIGTVPRLDKTILQCHDGILRIPIEGYWHFENSFKSGKLPTSIVNDNNIDYGPSSGFNSLLLFGDYGMMANPRIGKLGPTQFRLLTLLGIEFGTYAPTHRGYNPIETAQNKGFTTGWGPQLGTGFAVINGPLTVYSYGTFCHGNVIGTDLHYRYNSYRVEAGIRYSDLINVRYSTGEASWQFDDNRKARIVHQVTVGIILDELNN